MSRTAASEYADDIAPMAPVLGSDTDDDDGESLALATPTRVVPPPPMPKSPAALVPIPPGMDWPLLATVMGLMTLGLVMSYSASIYVALHQHGGDDTHFLTRHFAHLGVALVALFFGTHVPYQAWRKLAYAVLVAAVIALAAVLMFGETRNRATRWLLIAGVPFQPAEAAKFAFVIYLAHSLTKKISREVVGSFTLGFLPHAFVWLVVFALCMKQPDLGTGVVLAVLLFTLTYVAGTKVSYLILLVFGAVGALVAFVIHDPMRSRRLVAFLEPLQYRDTTGFQLFNGKLAVATGGLFGNGLGLSRQKLGFVPEAHTDFVLSIIAEELGLVGVALVALGFLFVLLRGMRIALRAHDEFGRLLAAGITILVGTQAAVNFSVVMGTLPTKGLTLPFVSHGGSSLAAMALAAGVLLNVGRGGNPDFAWPRLPGFGHRTDGTSPKNLRHRARSSSSPALVAADLPDGGAA
ncbi:MAG: putative lipid II flippase FtsW [Myxococcales bacterium]|nr:putative lipid II flippase FtsW [Myxococcales bacterium]